MNADAILAELLRYAGEHTVVLVVFRRALLTRLGVQQESTEQRSRTAIRRAEFWTSLSPL